MSWSGNLDSQTPGASGEVSKDVAEEMAKISRMKILWVNVD